MRLTLPRSTATRKPQPASDRIVRGRRGKGISAEVRRTGNRVVESSSQTVAERITPQPGPQTSFLQTSADIAIYGGGAGGGKTFGLMMDAARWCALVNGFVGVIFRRTFPEITNPGGLWDESMKLFPKVGGTGNRSAMRWDWPTTNSWLKFSHMQRETDVLTWQGAQLAFVAFDELTHFSRSQFFYMLSRLRSSCGVIPYLRASCNPDCDSWVAEFLSWWIDQESGFPISSRSGVLRWMVNRGESLAWFSTQEEAKVAYPDIPPLSVTFIPAKLSDNPALMVGDPNYLAKMMNLPAYERRVLLDGNWKVRRVKGMLFRPEWFRVLPAIPTDVVRWVRYWDRAATEPSEVNPDPDWTSGTLMGRRTNGRFVIADQRRLRDRPSTVEAVILNCSTQDPDGCEVWLQQEPGAAGVSEISHAANMLAGRPVHVDKVTKAKWTRAKPMSSQAEVGNIDLVRAPWNTPFLQELDGFVDEDQVDVPDGYHDDQVDSATGAFNALCSQPMPSIS